MLYTIIFVVVIFTLLYLFYPKELTKLYKLKKIIEIEYDTKVEFSYETKIMGTYLYIFTDDSTAYTINEFGRTCGKRSK